MTPELPLHAWRSVLGEVRAVQPAYPGARVWRVTAQDGRAYAVKRREGQVVPLATEHRVLVHLRESGVAVAVPVLTDDGRICARSAERAGST